MTTEYIEKRFIELKEQISACVNDLDSFLSLTADMKGNYISFIHIKTSKGPYTPERRQEQKITLNVISLTE